MNTTKPYLRGIVHCHSNYSHDSVTRISSYLKCARRHDLDFIVLTDHDTIAGSMALKAAAAQYMPNLEVPVAAEYLTDEGDVIAAFMTEDIGTRNFSRLADRAREQNAVLFLPHPYVGHATPEKLAPHCDLIEVINCRTRDEQNRKALRLAQSLGKRTYAGSDAHFARSLASAIVEVENLGDLRRSFLNGQVRWQTPTFTKRWEYGASQFLKSCKLRDRKLALQLVEQAWGRLSGKARERL